MIQEDRYETTPSEGELLDKIRAGDSQAFSNIVRAYQKLVFKVAYHFFQNGDDAMEIVQETFLRFHQNVGKLGHDTSLKYWIYRVAYNISIDFYRKYRKKRVPEQELYDRQLNGQHHQNPENKAEEENFKHHLKSSVLKLSGRQQRVFMLKHFDGLKYQEIADVLSISVGTVKSLHHRAVQKLKKEILWRSDG